MKQSGETPQQHDPETGPEKGLRSGSTAGDSHGETVEAPDENSEDGAGKSPGDRRKELLKEE